MTNSGSPIFIAPGPFGEQAVHAPWSHWYEKGDLAVSCVAGTAKVELAHNVPTGYSPSATDTAKALESPWSCAQYKSCPYGCKAANKGLAALAKL